MFPEWVFISGEMKVSDRQKEYREVSEMDNKVIVATYGVAAVGINIPRIFNLVLLEPGKSYIKPFVTSKVSNTMCGGLNFLNKVSVPWDLTCDEIIYCMEGTFRLTCDGQSYICNPGDVLYIPKDNHIAYECDEKCVIFYAAYPHDWKQQAGITFVPGIDPEDMPQ